MRAYTSRAAMGLAFETDHRADQCTDENLREYG